MVSTSPLYASDRAVADGRRRSSTTLGRAPIPIKKIAFKVPQRKDADQVGAASKKSADELEEFDAAIKREAREAGVQACKRAHMGIVPGFIYNDGETTKITSIGGSFGTPVTDTQMKKKRAKKVRSISFDDAAVAHTNHSNFTNRSQSQYDLRGEEKVEIEEEDEISVPLTFETRSATFDNATTVSEGTKSSIKASLSKRLFTKSQKNISNTRTPAQNQEDALKEARSLLSSGAWICGVCGTPFNTSVNAKRHEKLCLVEWLKHDKLVRQGWRDQHTPNKTSDDDIGVPEIFSEIEHRFYPEYSPPRTGGEISLTSPLVKQYLLMTDEALVNVARRQSNILHEVIDRDLCALSLRKQKAREDPSPATLDEYSCQDKRTHEDLFVWEREHDALRELELSSRDRHYYANLEQRAMERRYGRQPHLTHHDYYYHRLNRIRRAGSEAFNVDSLPDVKGEEKGTFHLKAKLWGGIKGRFDHAYKLVKEGPTAPADGGDHKGKRKVKEVGDSGINKGEIKHDKNTLYINVVVKNSVQMVNNEIQRIARGWWQTELNKSSGSQDHKEDILDFQFEWIRAHTQTQMIRLAGLALASDFTPRKVAVQLSYDLHRLMEPQLKHRGVSILASIEYREGQYFVLAVNILEIDFQLLMTWVAKQQQTHPNLALGQSRRWQGDATQAKKKKQTIQYRIKAFLTNMRQRFPSRNEVIQSILFYMYRMQHVSVLGLLVVPILQMSYFLFLKYAVDKFVLNAVTDDIFRYVEKKGMEMQLGIRSSNNQASFMLAALREIRRGDKKRKSMEDEDEDARPIIGPLLGPRVKDDNIEARPPPDFSPPDVLEFTGLETDLPVGFLRLRWAMLNAESNFLKVAFYADVMKYDKIELGQWSANENEIGLPKPPDGTDESSFVGQSLECSYLMPKSAFVKANMCYATLEIVHYSNHCLVIKEKTLTPEVPYGSTFVAWTQYNIFNTGKNTCRMVCSVEAEFPNGPPMVARQIKSGMRTGTAEKFVSLAETICRYADSYP